MPSPDLYFATFAQASWAGPLNRIRREAEAMGVFKDVFVFTEADLDPWYLKKHQRFMHENRRGFGFYLWKPQVVVQALERMPLGAVLVYADAGCVLNKEGIPRLREYAQMVQAHPSGVLGFNITYPMEDWTRPDVVAHYKMTPEERRSPQHAGGIHITHNVPEAKAFMTHWRDECEHYHLICDHPSFPNHRHDQSIYSILFHRYKCLSIPDETWWEPHWDKNKHYPIHARRLRG
jgi:hypothetical protein